jgi:hypothetical protein
MKKIYSSLLFASLCFSFTSCLKEDPNPAHGVPNPIAPVEILRAAYKGSDVKITSDKIMSASKITGVVISDAASQNFSKGSFVMENTNNGKTRGITILLGESADVPYKLGDSLLIEVNGASLVNSKGSLQLTGIDPSKITKVGENMAVKPLQIALSELAANFSKYEGTLVQVNADVKPTPAAGETYSGDKGLFNGSETDITLHTEANASFATRRVPASASFIGIATYYNEAANTQEGAKRQLRMRSIDDAVNASGPLYASFPEDFESPDASVKGSYNMTNNNVNLKTGSWRLYQAILANTSGRDRFNPAGKQCIRMQQGLSENAYVEMNFDLPYGASKVTLSYGSYYTDPGSTWKLEYSTDGGVTWTQVGNDIKDASATPKVATFLMNITSPVRFRINKLGLGASNGTTIFNGRLSIEDIAIYQN